MRLAAFLVSLLALAAAALAGERLWRTLDAPLPARAAPAAATPAPAGTGPGPAPPPRDWPALFGTEAVAEPQPPAPPTPAPEPQPPAPPAPPLESLGYTLQGVVSGTDARWALVSHPTGELLLRVGDALSADYTVAAIDAAGLWVTDRRGQRTLLGFAK